MIPPAGHWLRRPRPRRATAARLPARTLTIYPFHCATIPVTESTAAPPLPLDARLPDGAPPTGWHPLPRRGALLHAAGAGFALAIPLGMGGGMAVSTLLDLPRIPVIAAAAL